MYEDTSGKHNRMASLRLSVTYLYIDAPPDAVVSRMQSSGG